MKTVFQVIFCVLSCLSIVAAVFLGIFLGLLWCLVGIAAAAVFASLMLLMKHGSPFRAHTEPRPDFMNTEEQNEKIRREAEQTKEED